jgi:hypothetical protein
MAFLQYISQAYRFLPVCLFILCLPCAVSAGEQQDSYRMQLIEKSRKSGIAGERGWRVLLHYPDEAGGKSTVDDPVFFLAPDGKKDPGSELQATLEGFFAPAELGDKHPRCRFPAREAWLAALLEIDTARLAQPVCSERDEYLRKLNPHSASIMFPAAYMNSPASMFGHTFIRIDGDYESELLSYAVNYAARTEEENGLVYAWKGLFGNYNGYFSILPQYAKIREYSSLEHRDIWEYRTNLTADEVRRMALHVWELGNIYSEYYFFDENCSYNLLFLLEAARPTVHLTDKTAPIVVPLDTIVLARSEGLLTSTGYRPSQGRRIRAITRLMTGDDIRLAQELAGPLATPPSSIKGLEAERRTRVLDLAVELLQYSYAKEKVDQDSYRKRILPLLTERSRLGGQKADPYPIQAPVEPEQGHDTRRFSISAGISGGSPFTTLGFRPAYHSLDDPGDGYVEGAQIQFMDTSLRYYFDREELQLQRLSLVDIVSLSEFETIFRRTSWKVTAGFDQVRKRNGDDVLVFRLKTGGGLTLVSDLLGMVYGLCETDGNLGPELRDWYALGFGFSFGIVRRLGDRLQLQLHGSSIWYPLGEQRYNLTGKGVLTFPLNRGNSLAAEASHSITSGHVKEEALLVWHHYF